MKLFADEKTFTYRLLQALVQLLAGLVGWLGQQQQGALPACLPLTQLVSAALALAHLALFDNRCVQQLTEALPIQQHNF